jgi:hypothetical protein
MIQLSFLPVDTEMMGKSSILLNWEFLKSVCHALFENSQVSDVFNQFSISHTFQETR